MGQIKPLDWHSDRGTAHESRHRDSHELGVAMAGPRTLILANPPAWMKRAKCLDKWVEHDLPEGGRVSAGRAKALCGGCPVLIECLEAAMLEENRKGSGYRYGVRGGLSPEGRFQLAQRRKAAL
jgi:hypothetical protein